MLDTRKMQYPPRENLFFQGALWRRRREEREEETTKNTLTNALKNKEKTEFFLTLFVPAGLAAKMLAK